MAIINTKQIMIKDPLSPHSSHFDFGTPPPSPPPSTTTSKSPCLPLFTSKLKTNSTVTSISDKYSTSKPWYHTTIGKRLGPEARELLENYSHIPPEEVDAHVYKMVCNISRIIFLSIYPIRFLLFFHSIESILL